MSRKIPSSTPQRIPSELYDRHPLEMFLQWFNQLPLEHQLELSGFIGHFCYEKFYLACETDGAKIFACREYLKSCESIADREEKLLLFVDDIIEFIVEINEIADDGTFACEEIIYELRDIISLYTMINELPQRSKRWLLTYHEWLHFKKRVAFFRSTTESLPVYDKLIANLQGNLKRHL